MHYIAQSLVAINDRGALLTWDPVNDSDLDGYNIYMAENESKNFVKVNKEPVWPRKFITPILRPDVKYYFYITSVDTSGNESDPSNVVEFMLSDARPNPNLRRVAPPSKEAIGGYGKIIRDISFGNFMTRFEWIDGYMTSKKDVVIPAGEMVSRAITSESFTTFFAIGG